MSVAYDDLFSATEQTHAINALPYQPGGPISRRRLFREDPMRTTGVGIELIHGALTLIQSGPRGAPAEVHPHMPRGKIEFKATHVRTRSTLIADSWQDRTGYGTGQLAVVEQERDRILRGHRRRIETTIDWHRTGAIQGKVLDADGATLIDLLAEFNVSQQSHDCKIDTSTTHVPNELIAARRLAEAALGDDAGAVRSWVAFCSAGFIDAARAHPSVEAYAAGWGAAVVLRDDIRSGGLVLGGVELVEVPNGASKTWIPDGEAFLCPEGIDGLFVTYFAPADYADTVNSEALPMYSRSEPLPFNRGYAMESQSNPLSICTRPRAVVKLTA